MRWDIWVDSLVLELFVVFCSPSVAARKERTTSQERIDWCHSSVVVRRAFWGTLLAFHWPVLRPAGFWVGSRRDALQTYLDQRFRQFFGDSFRWRRLQPLGALSCSSAAHHMALCIRDESLTSALVRRLCAKKKPGLDGESVCAE